MLKALTLARSLLVDANPKKYFENGIRKRVKGTEYSELNVRKYIVKIYTKLMKFQPNPIGKFIVRDECNKVKRLAVKNIFFYTSPSILIQVKLICVLKLHKGLVIALYNCSALETKLRLIQIPYQNCYFLHVR